MNHLVWDLHIQELSIDFWKYNKTIIKILMLNKSVVSNTQSMLDQRMEKAEIHAHGEGNML